MYSSVLLTSQESRILINIIDYIQVQNADLYNKEQINLHIIKRHLLGAIPTKSVNEHNNGDNYPQMKVK